MKILVRLKSLREGTGGKRSPAHEGSEAQEYYEVY